jgi:hypothetical protein
MSLEKMAMLRLLIDNIKISILGIHTNERKEKNRMIYLLRFISEKILLFKC